MMEYHKYFFSDDGTVPNSHLPVIIYSQVVYNSSLSDWFENKFKENNIEIPFPQQDISIKDISESLLHNRKDNLGKS